MTTTPTPAAEPGSETDAMEQAPSTLDVLRHLIDEFVSERCAEIMEAAMWDSTADSGPAQRRLDEMLRTVVAQPAPQGERAPEPAGYPDDRPLKQRLEALAIGPRLFDFERKTVRDAAQAVAAAQPASQAAPIDMVLFCPACGMQHIDAAETHGLDVGETRADAPAEWSNPPHRSHLCHGCGHTWRPADVPTNGVQAVKTCGQNDSPIAQPASQASAGAVPDGWRLVPVRPTRKMLKAGDTNQMGYGTELGASYVRHQWASMLDAAPVAPSAASQPTPEQTATLDRVADNARELGLDYGDDAPTEQTAAAPVQAGPSDDEIDRVVAQAMDDVAAARQMHALELNPDITQHHTLRRAIVRKALARYGSQPADAGRDAWVPLLLGRKADPMPATHTEVDLTLSTGAVVPGSWLGPDIGWDWVDTDDTADAEANVVAWRPRPAPYKRAAIAADATKPQP